MPVADKPVTYSWMPKGAGKGGQFSNATSHDSDTDYLSFVLETVVDGAQWKMRPSDTLFGSTQFANSRIDSMYVFNAYSQSKGQIYSFLLCGTYMNTPTSAGNVEFFNSAGTRGGGYTMWINGGGGATSPNGPYSPICFQSVKNKCYAANGANPAVGAGLLGPQIFYDQLGTGVTLQLMAWGLPAPTTNLQVTVRSTISGTGNTHGTTTVDNLSFNPQTNLAAGMPFYIDTLKNGQFAEFTIATVPTISSVTVTSTTANDGVTLIGTQTGTPVQGNFGSLTWDATKGQGYRYAISYGDTVRGHVGDIGPIFEVKWGPPNNKRVDLTIANICDIEKTPDTRYAGTWQYNAIVLWRSANSGGTLQPLAAVSPAGVLNSYVQSYPDSQSDDSVLGTVFPGAVGAEGKSVIVNSVVVGGPHAPPPIDINYITYWEGRFFGARTSNPGVGYFSAAVNEVSYGVPEECWNPLNTFPVPEADGVITGFQVVGASLICLTQNNIYEVRYAAAGSSSIFRLQRLSAKGQGGGHFSSTTLPGEDAQSGDILVHYGNDSRLYFLYGAGGDIPFSYPVQDVMNTFGPASGQFAGTSWTEPVRVNVWHDKKAAYLIVQPSQDLAPSAQYALLYDLDRKIWLTLSCPLGTFTQGLFNGAITPFISDNTGSVYRFSDGTTGTASHVLRIYTQQVNVPGTSRHDEKALQAVFLYGAPYTSGQYSMVAVADEGGTVIPMVEISASTDPRMQAYLDAPDAHMFVPQGSTASGRTFQIQTQLVLTGIPVTGQYVSEIMALWSVKSPTTGTV